jgi:hypothetical protein
MPPGSGIDACDEDAAGFDGWYTDRAIAAAIMRDWVKRFPHWVVGLVLSDQIWFGAGNYA